MKARFSDEQLRFAARLYYIDGVSQTVVAKMVRVSQAKVSRLLAIARERGIVRITVEEYNPQNPGLEQQLRTKFGLKHAAVVKTVANATGEVARQTVGHFGAPIIANLIPTNGIVAIAGGRTVREIVEHLPEGRARGLTIVQAMGSIDSNISAADAIELGRHITQLWGGTFLTLTTPAFAPDKKTRDAFLAFEQIRYVWKRFGEAHAALVGVGTLENSAFVERGVLSARDLDVLKESGAVGEICGRFFDRQGRECDTPWRDRVISIDFDQLKAISQSIAVFTGADRSAAVAAAIRGGLVKSIVTDEGGAEGLLGDATARAKKKKK
jgi:DNA-binding transcriptional regulator LsrR (DeoR family)